MRDLGIIKGGEEAAQPIVIGKDTVYIHFHIQPVVDDEMTEGMFQYRELQFELSEYLQLLTTKDVETLLRDLEEQYG